MLMKSLVLIFSFFLLNFSSCTKDTQGFVLKIKPVTLTNLNNEIAKTKCEVVLKDDRHDLKILYKNNTYKGIKYLSLYNKQLSQFSMSYLFLSQDDMTITEVYSYHRKGVYGNDFEKYKLETEAIVRSLTRECLNIEILSDEFMVIDSEN